MECRGPLLRFSLYDPVTEYLPERVFVVGGTKARSSFSNSFLVVFCYIHCEPSLNRLSDFCPGSNTGEEPERLRVEVDEGTEPLLVSEHLVGRARLRVNK